MSKGTVKIDRNLRAVGGRFKHATGTSDPTIIASMKVMLKTLDDRGDYEHIRAIQEGKLTLMEVWQAWSQGKLAGLQAVEEILPLKATMLKWLDSYKDIAPNTREKYRYDYGQLFKMATKADTGVNSLPKLLKKYRDQCEKNDTARQFQMTKNAVRSFLANHLGKSHPLYLAVVDIKGIPVIKKRAARSHSFPVISAVAEKLPEESRKVMWTLVTTGMGWLEYQNFEVVENKYIWIHGKKVRRIDDRRNRKVPLIQMPHKPTMAERTFRKHLKKASGGEMTTYDLRHTYAGWLLDAGIPFNRQQQYMGHQPKSMTQMYSQVKLEDYLVKDALAVQKWLKEQLEGPKEEAPPLETGLLF